jgi:hypothetical protein
MIIAFYPGAGGHRYKLFLQNLYFQKKSGSMHWGTMPYQYITDDTVKTTEFSLDEIALSHTLNDEKLKLFFPGHEIIKLKADLKKCLRREWNVVMKERWLDKSEKDQIGQIFDMIAWHHNYYARFPVDWTTETVIDIATDITEFGQVMREQLDIVDPQFDFAWSCYSKFGASAPIIDLYNEQK